LQLVHHRYLPHNEEIEIKMGPVPLIDLVLDARKKGRAVGSFSCLNLETAAAIVSAAEEVGIPVAVAFTARHASWVDLPALAAALRSLADRASVSVAVHLDHATDLETVRIALENGFTSVMIESPRGELEDQVRFVREVVTLAHRYGATVEAELTPIPQKESLEGGQQLLEMTDPMRAAYFAHLTGIDILAVSVGNVHHQDPGEASLDLSRLREIASSAPCALSLHGGSGLSDSLLLSAVAAGIGKVSFYTRLARAAVLAIREHALVGSELPVILESLKKAYRQEVVNRLLVLWGNTLATT
jgi:fructose-bisphosphate aldolase class II